MLVIHNIIIIIIIIIIVVVVVVVVVLQKFYKCKLNVMELIHLFCQHCIFIMIDYQTCLLDLLSLNWAKNMSLSYGYPIVGHSV